MPMPCPRTSRSSSTATRPGWPTSSWPPARITASSEATKTVDASFVYSDHSPFWDNGYPALLAIEDNPLTNPYYHRTTDTLDTLNLDFFTSATRASVGLLAELAQPIKAGYPRTPVGFYADSVVYRSLFNSLHSRPADLDGANGRGRLQHLQDEHPSSRLRQDQYDARDRDVLLRHECRARNRRIPTPSRPWARPGSRAIVRATLNGWRTPGSPATRSASSGRHRPSRSSVSRS